MHEKSDDDDERLATVTERRVFRRVTEKDRRALRRKTS
jgi:hypothetical protein